MLLFPLGTSQVHDKKEFREKTLRTTVLPLRTCSGVLQNGNLEHIHWLIPLHNTVEKKFIRVLRRKDVSLLILKLEAHTSRLNVALEDNGTQVQMLPTTHESGYYASLPLLNFLPY